MIILCFNTKVLDSHLRILGCHHLSPISSPPGRPTQDVLEVREGPEALAATNIPASLLLCGRPQRSCLTDSCVVCQWRAGLSGSQEKLITFSIFNKMSLPPFVFFPSLFPERKNRPTFEAHLDTFGKAFTPNSQKECIGSHISKQKLKCLLCF